MRKKLSCPTNPFFIHRLSEAVRLIDMTVDCSAEEFWFDSHHNQARETPSNSPAQLIFQLIHTFFHNHQSKLINSAFSIFRKIEK